MVIDALRRLWGRPRPVSDMSTEHHNGFGVGAAPAPTPSTMRPLATAGQDLADVFEGDHQASAVCRESARGERYPTTATTTLLPYDVSIAVPRREGC
jgi:hypothetical protein